VEISWLILAFTFGFIAKKVGLPPLVGYLTCGFIISANSSFFGNASEHLSALSSISHAGVLLLLFTVGLKLNIKHVLKKEIICTGVAHALLSTLIFAPAIFLFFSANMFTALVIAASLSFSSTVLAAKTLESKQELKAFHGRITIGILIIQDLIAMAVMSSTSGDIPSVYAVSLLSLPFLIRPLHYLIEHSGHDEMLLLLGIGLAVAGGAWFGSVGLSSELGALTIGALCAKSAKSSELYGKLWGIKEIFLVGFFLTIGLYGVPTLDDIKFAVAMTLLLPLQTVLFFIILTRFNLTSRSAFLSSISLSSFSEFGLIVTASAIPEWIVPMALAVSFSFILSAPLNRFSHELFESVEKYLAKFETSGEHPDEATVKIGGAKLLIIGMGEVGVSVYAASKSNAFENYVIGFDSDPDKVNKLKEEGFNVIYADAEHANFWLHLDKNHLECIILTTSCTDTSILATTQIRKSGFRRPIIAHSTYSDDARKLMEAGADDSYAATEEAGCALIASANKHLILADQIRIMEHPK
jgi:predicted Kef-type K+ transport protein